MQSSESTPLTPLGRIKRLKELNVISGTALVVNICVGSGIFITSSGVFKCSQSFGLTILLWFFGGVMIDIHIFLVFPGVVLASQEIWFNIYLYKRGLLSWEDI